MKRFDLFPYLISSVYIFALSNTITLAEQSIEPAPAIVVQAEGDGLYVGHDDRPIIQAIEQLKAQGGVLLIQAGRYVLHRPLVIPANVTVRGEAETVLALPHGTRIIQAQSAGDKSVKVQHPQQFRPGTVVQILPENIDSTFTDGKTKWFNLDLVEMRDNTLIFAEALPFDVPEQSRLGYPHHAIKIAGDNVTLENLTIDGGMTTQLPMLGHADRCGVWAVARYKYEKGPLEEPLKNLMVRHCTFSNCYGRGVSFYNVTNSKVIGCRFQNIEDEAINFDHFTFRCQALGNIVYQARRGVVLNDAGNCTIAYNRLIDCPVGIHMFWWYKVGDYPGVNQHNHLIHNTILGARDASITMKQRVTQNIVEFNYVDKPIKIAEQDNCIQFNSILSSVESMQNQQAIR